MENMSNAELLQACNWEVFATPDCDDSDCECKDCVACCRIAKFRRIEHDAEGKIAAIAKKARRLLRGRRICHYCCGKLVPVGRARANGKPHEDWTARQYHKKCWLSLLRGDNGYRTGGVETDMED